MGYVYPSGRELDLTKIVNDIGETISALSYRLVAQQVHDTDAESDLIQDLSLLWVDLDLSLNQGREVDFPRQWSVAVDRAVLNKLDVLTRQYAEMAKERDDLRDQNRELLDQVQCLQWDLGALQSQHDQCPEPSMTKPGVQ